MSLSRAVTDQYCIIFGSVATVGLLQFSFDVLRGADWFLAWGLRRGILFVDICTRNRRLVEQTAWLGGTPPVTPAGGNKHPFGTSSFVCPWETGGTQSFSASSFNSQHNNLFCLPYVSIFSIQTFGTCAPAKVSIRT